MDFVGNNQITVYTTRSNEGMNASNDHQQLKRFPGENPDDDEIDCTLKLGLPYNSPEQVPTTNQKPTPTVMPTSNMYYRSSQVLNNYGVVNGTGVAYGTRFPWIPTMMNPDNNMGGFGLYGGLSMALPGSSYPCNNYGQYLGFYKPQNNVPVNNIIQRRAEPEPPTDSIHNCFACKTTTTPLWRNGPNGPKTLCNACGIRYKKEEKRIIKMRTTEANVSNPHKKPKY